MQFSNRRHGELTTLRRTSFPLHGSKHAQDYSQSWKCQSGVEKHIVEHLPNVDEALGSAPSTVV